MSQTKPVEAKKQAHSAGRTVERNTSKMVAEPSKTKGSVEDSYALQDNRSKAVQEFDPAACFVIGLR